MKLTRGVNFINIPLSAFARPDPESTKKTDNLTVFFCAFGICVCKSSSQSIDEIDTWCPFRRHFMASFFKGKSFSTIFCANSLWLQFFAKKKMFIKLVTGLNLGKYSEQLIFVSLLTTSFGMDCFVYKSGWGGWGQWNLVQLFVNLFLIYKAWSFNIFLDKFWRVTMAVAKIDEGS